MYKVEFDYVERFMDVNRSKVLDVGCAGGEFLDIFSKHGAVCEGVEFGEEAYKIVSSKYKAYLGELTKIEFDTKYDLIIFRGVIQYFIDPKKYMNKACDCLEKGGLLFITSSPNSESLCFNLFKDRFTLPVGVTDYYAYSEKIITEFLSKKGMKLIDERFLYLETPYADIVNDTIIVADALNKEKNGEYIECKSPPFVDNMLTLLYRKE